MGLRNFKKKATQDDLAAARNRVVNEAVTVDWGAVERLAPLPPVPPRRHLNWTDPPTWTKRGVVALTRT